MKFDKKALRLYAVTDRSWLCGQSLASRAELALKGGATMLQLREKGLPQAELLAEAREMKALCGRYGVPLIVNDSVEAALDSDADGVHLGQGDLCAKKARRLLGPGKILGVSARTAAQAMEAEQNGADYLGAGAMFGTATKADAKALSLGALREICSAVSIPVVAIGGITVENLPLLRGSGIAGIAVVSGIFAQPNIEESCRALCALANEVLG
ncbi:MAG: thiamine phosphate synthase [Christensenellaceae bacterium]|nr:thiamine phosphate synthase [Christensenellaceae bacterium]